MRYRVGYGRMDITPQSPVSLAGIGIDSKRVFKVVRDPIYATCLAVTDCSDTTVLLCSLDILHPTRGEYSLALRQAVSEATGVAMDNILISCTHTHSGPAVYNPGLPGIPEYRQYLLELLTDAAKQAMADRTAADLYVGQGQTQNLNFVKHYKYFDAEGKRQYFGDNFGTQVLDETTEHTTQADPTMHLVKITRAGKKDIVLANWRAHPLLTAGSAKYDLSADFIGDFRDVLERRLDCDFVFFQGAAGNINSSSRIAEEVITKDCRAYGVLLADTACEGLKTMTPLKVGAIKTLHHALELPVDKPNEEMMEHVLMVQKVWQETARYDEAVKAGLPYGIRSPYHANALAVKYRKDDYQTNHLFAVSFGEELAIVSAPNELFDTISMFVEANAPYPKVLTFGYTNDYTGYIPSAYGFRHTSYETDCCHYKAGVGEIYQETFLQMLNTLKGEQ